LLVPGADPVRKVTIIPHGGALGVTISRPIDDRFNYGEDYLRARIIGALGGRAAEQLIYSTVSTGAANDLQQVTGIAHEMVVRWGMSPKIGQVAFAEDGSNNGLLARPYSEATARDVDTEVKRIADECFTEAMRLLTEQRPKLEALTKALLKDDSLDNNVTSPRSGEARIKSSRLHLRAGGEPRACNAGKFTVDSLYDAVDRIVLGIVGRESQYLVALGLKPFLAALVVLGPCFVVT
jgi:cell division protease FtsH